MSRCIPSINPNLPIPELIKITQHSNRECDFLEVQSILMEREKKMQIEIQNLQMGHDSAKKQALQEVAGLKKKKLRRSRRKCKALNEETTSLNFRVVKLGEEIEGLKQGKEELKRHNVEAAKALDELRERKRESDELAKLYECSFEARITKVEGSLARLLNVKVEDLAKLVAALETCGAATKPENLDFGPGDRNLVHTQKEDDDGAKSGGCPRVEPHVSGKITFGAQAGDVIEIHDDSDDEINHDHATHVSDTSSEQINKRKGRDCTGVSPLNFIRETKKRICSRDKEEEDVPTDEKETQVPCDDSQILSAADSDEELSYSDAYMDDLVATFQKRY
ncbi:hypothetical protein ACS0TY_000720 [Phlomoides rotata]